MRILEVNKFFYPRGGAEQVFFDTIRLLRGAGDTVAEFSMQSEQNLASEFDSYFVSELPDLLGSTSVAQKLKIFNRLFYSHEVNKKLTRLVRDFRPDVAHVHNAYHHLSASLFTTLRRLGVPTVLTVHDAFPFTPNHSFMVDGHLEENLLFNSPYNTIAYRAIDNQLLPSIAGALEFWYYRARHVWPSINHFVSPSNFYANLLHRANIDAKKITVIPNAIAPVAKTAPLGKAVSFIGRLHAEKGFDIFMESVRRISRSVPVIVAGDGPLSAWGRDFALRHDLHNVEFVGFLGGRDLSAILDKTRVVAVPSVFYENCSLTILEALSLGRLVVASDRGGNPEIVKNNFSGWLCDSENPTSLAGSLEFALAATPTVVARLQKNAHQLLVERHSESEYLKNLHAVFEAVVS